MRARSGYAESMDFRKSEISLKEAVNFRLIECFLFVLGGTAKRVLRERAVCSFKISTGGTPVVPVKGESRNPQKSLIGGLSLPILKPIPVSASLIDGKISSAP